MISATHSNTLLQKVNRQTDKQLTQVYEIKAHLFLLLIQPIQASVEIIATIILEVSWEVHSIIIVDIGFIVHICKKNISILPKCKTC